MDRDTLEKANELDTLIKSTKNNINYLEKLAITQKDLRLTDGYSIVYQPGNTILRPYVNKMLSDEKDKLKKLEFQLNIL